MSLKLECLKLKFPSIDLLETRQLLGGSGNGYINENGEWDLGQLDEANVRPNDEDRYDDHREYEDHDDGDYGYDGNDGGPGGKNSDGGSGGFNGSSIGNPKDLSMFPAIGEPQLGGSGMCVSEVIAQILNHFGATSLDVNSVINALNKASIANFIQILDSGLNSAQTVNAFNHFFETSKVSNGAELVDQLNSNNPVFATIINKDADGNIIYIRDAKGDYAKDSDGNKIMSGYAVVIYKAVTDGTDGYYDYYDPELGKSVTGFLYDFTDMRAIEDLNQNYYEQLRDQDRGREQEQRDPDIPGEDHSY